MGCTRVECGGVQRGMAGSGAGCGDLAMCCSWVECEGQAMGCSKVECEGLATEVCFLPHLCAPTSSTILIKAPPGVYRDKT